MSETTRLLDDAAERLLSRRLADPLARTDPHLPASLLAEIGEAGLSHVLAPEENGGLGAGLAEATTIAWRMGFHAAPTPVAPMLLLPTLPGGEAGAHGSATLASPASVEFSGDRLLGGCVEAPAIAATRVILLVCPSNRGDLVVEIDTSSAKRFHALDGQLWLSVDPADAHILDARPSPVATGRLAIQGALITAAAMIGAMARELDITIDHANTRKQFGRPLGKFQAVQNMIAAAASEHAVAQAAVSGAIHAEDGGWGRPLLWRSAKALAGQAAAVVTSAAHQTLGAIGFTEEHPLHCYSKKLWVWRDDWGRQSALETAIGEAACADLRGLWAHIADDAA